MTVDPSNLNERIGTVRPLADLPRLAAPSYHFKRRPDASLPTHGGALVPVGKAPPQIVGSRSADRFLPAVYGSRQLRVQPAQKALAFAGGPEAKSPCLLVEDISWSGKFNGAMKQINAANDQFGRDINRDKMLAGELLCGLMAFGGTPDVELIQPFVPPAQFRPPKLHPQGLTPLYRAVITGVQVTAAASERIETELSLDCRSAWMWVFTDGLPTDDENAPQAIYFSRSVAHTAGINIFYVGAGEDADMQVLQRLAQPGRPPIRMPDIHDFAEFFAWLVHSLRQKSVSQPGLELRLDHPFDPGKFLLADA